MHFLQALVKVLEKKAKIYCTMTKEGNLLYLNIIIIGEIRKQYMMMLSFKSLHNLLEDQKVTFAYFILVFFFSFPYLLFCLLFAPWAIHLSGPILFVGFM